MIPELVKTGAADRLIVGTHGRRHLKKLLLGSVAQEILAKVQVPVCTIGPHVQMVSASREASENPSPGFVAARL